MFFAFLYKSRQRLILSLCLAFCFLGVQSAEAMPVGTLLYRTASNGNMYGYNSNKLLEIKHGLIRSVYTGHVAIYVGKENGIDYIVEAGPKGVVKIPAKYFINLDKDEHFLGAKIPKNLNEQQRLKVSLIAKSLANASMSYDFDFRNQKGPASGDWTCVGLVEKIYESANIKNPLNVNALEYIPDNYAIDITPDGFDNYSVINHENGDVLSSSYEYSRISKVSNVFFPAPEKLAFNAGRIYKGERYFFFPMTQFMQASLEDVEVDISQISSSFKDEYVRGKIPSVSMAFKWTLINNPLASLENSINSVVSFFSKDKNQDVLAFLEEDKITDSQEYNDLAYNFSVQEDLINIEESITSEEEESLDISLLENIEEDVELVIYTNDNERAFISSDALVQEEEDYQLFEEFEAMAENEDYKEKYQAPLLISKIYATDKDDYIEIFNDSDKTINLSDLGIRLYKTKTSNKPYLMLRFGNESDASYPGGLVMGPKSRYLVVRSDASDDLLSQADAIVYRREFNFTGDAYTIYLSSGVVSSDDDEDVVDKVGYGNASYYYVKAAQEILNEHVLIRKTSQSMNYLEDINEYNKNFVYNSNNNYFDFILFSLIEEEDLLVEEEEEDNNNLAEEEEDEEEEEEKEEEKEEEEEEEELEIVSRPELLISHIYATGKDDYILIYNHGNSTINLSDANVRLYKTKTREIPYLMLRFGNESDASYPGGLIIEPKSSYMIVRADASDSLLSQADAVVHRSEFTFTGDAYTIYLSDGVVSSDNDDDIVDKVGYGSASFYYDFPASEILDNHLLIRKAKASSTPILMAQGCEHDILGHSYNTYDNSHDFVLLDLSLIQEGRDYCNNEIIDEEDSFSYFSNNLDYNYCVDDGLFVDNLINLWHFNECKGDLAHDFANTNNALDLDLTWINASHNCGISHHENNNDLTFNLNSQFNSNNFSVTFNYRILHPNSRPQFRFNNSETNQYFQFQLFAYYTEFRGFPNTLNRYSDILWPLSSEWQQFSLVVDKDEDYFAMYNNGVEYFKYNIGNNFLPDVDQLIFMATGNSSEFDELAVFSRALNQNELLNLYQEFKELNTTNCADKKFKKAQLISFYDFDNNLVSEDTSHLILSDIVMNNDHHFSSLHLNESDILNVNNNNYLSINDEVNYNLTDLENLKASKDWSLALWFKRGILDGFEEDLFSLNYFHFQLLFNSNPYFGFNLSDLLRYNFSSLDFEVLDSFDMLHSNWQHIALVYDSYKFHFKIYVNGDLKFIITKDWLNQSSFDNISLASLFTPSYVDDLMIFSGVLSPLDVFGIYNSTKEKFIP